MMLISVEGTPRIPRGGTEPHQRYAPAGSPYNRYFPQESRAFHYNQPTAKNQHCALTEPREM
jgi:hypothetical protein